MSTHVVGVIPADEKFRKMKDIWDQCEELGISCPVEVDAFFNDEPPDDDGVIVDIKSTEYSADMEAGLEVDLTTLPKDVKILRFYNSY